MAKTGKITGEIASKLAIKNRERVCSNKDTSGGRDFREYAPTDLSYLDEGEKTYCFTLEELKTYKISGATTNPYTGNKFPIKFIKDEIERLKHIRKSEPIRGIINIFCSKSEKIKRKYLVHLVLNKERIMEKITMDKSKNIRVQIKKDAVKDLFSKKGGANFRSLNESDIEKIFNLYDQKVFDGEIMKRIGKKGYLIEFKASKRTSGVGGITGYATDQPMTFYIDIAPNILETIFRSNKIGLPAAAGLENICKDRLGCLLLIIEHQIIHLIMMLWGYSNVGPFTPKSKYKTEEIFGPHGRLFQCLSNRFFGHTKFDHDLGLADISSSDSPINPFFQTHLLKKETKKGEKKRVTFLTGYQNWSYSCYLDSVLIILFYGASNFWRNIIFDKSPIDMKGSNLELAETLRDELSTDYKALHDKGKTIMCSNVRTLLLKKAPEMKENNKWVVFNAGAAYEAMANILPDFLLDIPIQIQKWTGERYKADTVKYVREAMLTFWDYMDPLTDIEKGQNYKTIRWDLIQSPVLVFTNGGAPRIKKMNETGKEKGETYIMGRKHKFKVAKARKFGEKIIDGRYDLIGVVVLQGVLPKKEGGSHYISYFKDSTDQWFKYDDLRPTIKKINELPTKGVWIEEKGNMPSMYFYRKMSVKPKDDWVIVPKSITPSSSNERASIENPSPVKTPVKSKKKSLEGEELDYKRIDRPDGYTLIYIKDKTFAKDKINTFKNLLKVGINQEGETITRTMLEPNVVTWRVPTKMMKQVERKIAKLLKD